MKIKDINSEEVEVSLAKIAKWVFIGAVCLSALAMLVSYTGMFATVATAPSRVISKTLDTDNIINNYEWFYDAHAQYVSRISQAAEHKQMLAGASDNPERSRLGIELSAIRQSCRDLATRYNANATKTNRSIFKGREAPESLSLEACDK